MASAAQFLDSGNGSSSLLGENIGYFQVLRTFQKSQALMSGLSLATVALDGTIQASFTHPQDMLHKRMIESPERNAEWLSRANNDFSVIPCVGGMVFMSYPYQELGETKGYILAGPVWETPPNREQRQELSTLFGWDTKQLREAIISHPATIPLDLSKGREVTISLATLTTDVLRVYREQRNNLTTFRKLYDISTRLGSSLELRAIVNTVIDGALQLVESSGCSLALIDDQKDTVTITFRSALDSCISHVDRIPLNGQLDSYVQECCKARNETSHGISSITLPIYIDGKCRGFICIVSNIDTRQYSNDDMQLLQIMASHASSAIEKSLVYTRAVRQFRELEVLQSVGLSLNSNTDTPQTLQQILDHTCSLLNAKTASVMLIEPDHNTLRIRIAKGLSKEVIRNTRVKLGERVSGIVAKEGVPKLITSDNSEFDEYNTSSLCVPLKVDDKIIGVLNVRGYADSEPFTREDLNLAVRLASMSAAAIETSELHDELQSLFLESITALANSIDARDRYTRGHSERVADYSLLMGDYLHFTQDELWRLRNAALLHDIGKIKIPDHILNKPGKLTDEEYEEMKLHPVYGAGIMHPVKSFSTMVPFILHHHERYDGTGYPDHKQGEEIPFYARIIAVADSFDAMTSTRPYRRCMEPDKAMRILRECSGTQLDPYLVNIFSILYRQGRVAPIVSKARQVDGTNETRARIRASAPGVLFFSGRDRSTVLSRKSQEETSNGGSEQSENPNDSLQIAKANDRYPQEKVNNNRLSDPDSDELPKLKGTLKLTSKKLNIKPDDTTDKPNGTTNNT